jgi:hypothetical protein
MENLHAVQAFVGLAVLVIGLTARFMRGRKSRRASDEEYKRLNEPITPS